MPAVTPLTDVMESLDKVDVCLRSLEELAGQADNKTAHQIAMLASYELEFAKRALEMIAGHAAQPQK